MASRRRAASHGAPISYNSQWWTKESQVRYRNTFSKRPILLERGVNWNDIHEVGVTRVIRGLGWESLFTPTKICCPALVREFYANIDLGIRNDGPMCYKVFIQNKILDITPDSINGFLGITNLGAPDFDFGRFDISNEELLTELAGSPDSGINLKGLYLPAEFTLFYRILNRLVCANLLPSNHPAEIGYQHARILYCIGKGIAFDVGIIILDEILSQAADTNPRIGLPYGCLLTNMILSLGISPTPDSDTVKFMGDIGKGTVSRSSAHTAKKHKRTEAGTSGATVAELLGDDDIEPPTGPSLTRQEMFENDMVTRMEALSNQMGAMHTLYEGLNRRVNEMDDRQHGIRTDVTAILTMVQDLHNQRQPPPNEDDQ